MHEIFLKEKNTTGEITITCPYLIKTKVRKKKNNNNIIINNNNNNIVSRQENHKRRKVLDKAQVNFQWVGSCKKSLRVLGKTHHNYSQARDASVSPPVSSPSSFEISIDPKKGGEQ